MEIAVSEERLKTMARLVDREMFPDRGHLRQSFAKNWRLELEKPHTFPEYLLSRQDIYLNNFYMLFPLPGSEISPARKHSMESKHINKTPQDLIRELEESFPNLRGQFQRLSQLALHQTYGDFYDTVESVVDKYKVNLVEFWALEEQWKNSIISITAFRKYIGMQLPSLIHLRALGYSRYDLTD